MSLKWVPVTDPQPGDSAQHKYLDLDPREVTRVEDTEFGRCVYLDFLGLEGGPLLARSYDYKRLVDTDKTEVQ